MYIYVYTDIRTAVLGSFASLGGPRLLGGGDAHGMHIGADWYKYNVGTAGLGMSESSRRSAAYVIASTADRLDSNPLDASQTVIFL